MQINLLGRGINLGGKTLDLEGGMESMQAFEHGLLHHINETHVLTFEKLEKELEHQRWDEECDTKSLFVSSAIQMWNTLLPCKSSPHSTSTASKTLFVSPTPGNAIPKRQCNAPTTIILREIRFLRRHHLGSSG